LTTRLAFKGWTTIQDNAGIVNPSLVNSIIVDVSSYKADRDYYFYAVFVEEDVYSAASDSKYFTFTQNAEKTGYVISGNPDYELHGKITLPTTYNG
jgi:hypothetical protein